MTCPTSLTELAVQTHRISSISDEVESFLNLLNNSFDKILPQSLIMILTK